uniref:Secreted protein n=1 Tax=Plectus sambesii TaxID=2011161 RepID=A0A914URV4_9BILA
MERRRAAPTAWSVATSTVECLCFSWPKEAPVWFRRSDDRRRHGCRRRLRFFTHGRGAARTVCSCFASARLAARKQSPRRAAKLVKRPPPACPSRPTQSSAVAQSFRPDRSQCFMRLAGVSVFP